MNIKNPYLPINIEWLDVHKEEALLPDLEIIDPHHHLWDLEFGKYLNDDFIEDINKSGHNIKASVYIMSSANTKIYDQNSNEFSTLPEIKFAYEQYLDSKNNKLNQCSINNSIVGALDLRYGKKLTPVIEKGLEISNGKLKGIRMLLAAHNDERISSGAVKTKTGIMLDPDFIEGAKILEKNELSLDFWIYHTQLNELEFVAKTLPNLSIILNHIGGPIQVGPYEGKQGITHREWRRSMMRLAVFPNIKVKLPPSSDQLSELWKSWFFETIDLFGTDRCMFESNFPVDKGSCSYGVLWNAFKKISEKNKLFYQNAKETYNIKI